MAERAYAGYLSGFCMLTSVAYCIIVFPSSALLYWLSLYVTIMFIQVPPSIDAFSERTDDLAELCIPPATSSKIADIVINGSLVEAELFVYGQVRSIYLN